MNTLEIDRHPVAVNVSVTEATLEVELADGRKISAPIVWFPRLEAATEEDIIISEVGSFITPASVTLNIQLQCYRMVSFQLKQ